MTKKLFFIILSIFQALPANALDSNTIPTEIVKNFSQTHLIGQNDLKVFHFNVYHIELWSETKTFSYQEKFAIHVNYKRDFSKESMVKRSIEEISRINNIKDEELLQNYSAILLKVFCDVKKGDSKTVIYDKKFGAKIFFNGSEVGGISDQKLARYFVDIWLSKNSSYPKMTNAILGKL